MGRLISVLLLGLVVPQISYAQFIPAFLQNRSYWGDGKSEVDFYQAEFVREGEPHQSEVLVILTPVFVEPNTMAYIDSGKQPGAIPGIRMIEAATIPRGLTAELRSIEAVWRMDSMSLARLSFFGNDVLGNIAKTIRENRQTNPVSWSYGCDSYLAKIDPQTVSIGTKQVVAYDELPLRVRTLDFSKTVGEFNIDLAATLASAAKDLGEFKPAKIVWKTGERNIDVEVQHAAGKDQFVLDTNFPFLLREWRAFDGTRWKMKNSIKVDYRKYLRNGDRERAWKDPMLRHPD
jgi:hypothetical protein